MYSIWKLLCAKLVQHVYLRLPLPVILYFTPLLKLPLVLALSFIDPGPVLQYYYCYAVIMDLFLHYSAQQNGYLYRLAFSVSE